MDPDDDLLTRASRDPEAFGAFYRRHEREVLGYFLRRTGEPEVAADLTAETFAAALVAARRYRPGAGPAGAWLFGIARHKLLHSRERQRVDDRARRRLGMAPLTISDEALEAIEALEADVEVRRLLDQLPDDQAEAVRARVLEERSYGDIARTLGASPTVIRKRVSRGLAALRRITAKEPR